MDVPHSGDRCSGLCRLPCEHLDCWQCAESREGIKQKGTQIERAVMTLAREREKRKPKPLSSEEAEQIAILGRRAQAYEAANKLAESDARARGKSITQPKAWNDQTVEITRAVLKDLCERAGVNLAWDSNDQPVIMNSSARIAEAIGKAAAATMDRTVADILTRQGTRDEEEARKVLKAQGASDEDIAAAAEILSWDTPKPKIELQYQTIDVTPMVAQWSQPSKSTDALAVDDVTRALVETWDKY